MNRTRNPESSPSPSRPEDARVAAELAALGEAEPDALEVSASHTGHAGRDAQDVALVLALFGLTHGAGPELTPLERRRVWRRIETRHGLGSGSEHGVEHTHDRKLGTSLWVGLAAAAVLVLLPFFAPQHLRPSSDPDVRASLVATGQLARRTLADLPGGQDEVRARALADDYAARLRGTAKRDDGGER